MNKAAKQIRKAEKAVCREIDMEIRDSFRQDFNFFVKAILGWPFSKRLRFCFDVMTKNLQPSPGTGGK